MYVHETLRKRLKSRNTINITVSRVRQVANYDTWTERQMRGPIMQFFYDVIPRNAAWRLDHIT